MICKVRKLSKQFSFRLLFSIKNSKKHYTSQMLNKNIYFFCHKIGNQEPVKRSIQTQKINNKQQQDSKQIQILNQGSVQQKQESQNSKSVIVNKNFNQTIVPGEDSRKYTNLNTKQQQIVSKNKFDLSDPQLVIKAGAKNTYLGINDDLKQISLGSVKIKGNDQVFLSQIDPKNIPDDLYIRFDTQKQLKIVGKQSNRKTQQPNSQNIDKQNWNKSQISIKPETIEQKSISEHMNQQFGISLKSYKYNNWKNIRRWDIFLSIIFFALLGPILQTFIQLHQFYKITNQIQKQRMKQIHQLKQRSYQNALLKNKDFNKSL